MFPGYVTAFRDKYRFVHLYFFPGITETGKQYYKRIDLSNCTFKYNKIQNDDSSEEYIFENTKIIKITCNLIDLDDNLHQKEISLK